MKHASRLLALALALFMVFSACAEEAQDASAQDPVLFTFDGEPYAKSRVDEFLADLLYYDYLDSENDYDTTIEFIIQEKLLDGKIHELGFDQYSDEERAAFRAEVLAELEPERDSIIDSYVGYFLTEDSEEARAALRADAEAYYNDLVENYLNSFISQDSYDRLLQKLFTEQGTPITEAQISESFAEAVAQQKEFYDANIYLYELFKAQGDGIWYQPAGYRGVLQILLGADSDLLNAYLDAQMAYEESLSGEENADSAALQAAAAEAARQAVLDSEKPAIDDIYARLEQGESFESLIERYGEDPGMKDETLLKTGYEVHPDSINMTWEYPWDVDFVSAAFSEKMQKIGDVSDPVVSPFGIQILYYLRDVPAGPVEMTDSIREDIAEQLEGLAKNDLINAALETWRGEHTIVMNTEAIENAKSAASASSAKDSDGLDSLSPEELEALFNQLLQPENAQEQPADAGDQ